MDANPRFPVRLTNREMDVLVGMVEGLSDQGIARKLGVGHETVKTFGKLVRRKLRATSRTQAAVRAIQYGLVEMDTPTGEGTGVPLGRKPRVYLAP